MLFRACLGRRTREQMERVIASSDCDYDRTMSETASFSSRFRVSSPEMARISVCGVVGGGTVLGP